MTWRGRIVLALVVVAVGIVLPSAASAHAYLIKTVPAAAGVLDVPPPNVQLTYDEAVEPRFAIVSVTNAAGKQETTGLVNRSPANPDTLVAPLRPHLPEGVSEEPCKRGRKDELCPRELSAGSIKKKMLLLSARSEATPEP